MKIKVQMCRVGGEKFCARALICGGLRVSTPDGVWTRKVATEMLDLLSEVLPDIDRKSIRFIHV